MIAVIIFIVLVSLCGIIGICIGLNCYMAKLRTDKIMFSLMENDISHEKYLDYMTYQELYTAYLNSYKQIKDINKAMKEIERSIPFCSKCADRASAKYNGTVK